MYRISNKDRDELMALLPEIMRLNAVKLSNFK